MLPLRHAHRWRLAGIVILLLVFTSALIPPLWPDDRQFQRWLVDTDKLLHAVTFVFLAAWFAGQYPPRSYWRIGAGLMAFGALIEIAQRFVSYRSAEWFDLVADTLGIVVGLLIATAGLGGWSLRLENWYEHREVSLDRE